jgi:BirA family biotin operon repressor/biotin-[acetyl-CoA-carboxylase] ligase
MSTVSDLAAAGPLLPDSMRLFIREEVDSTNDEIRRLGLNGSPDGTVLIADRQTAGRGRRGAKWVCPPGEALAFSVLVRTPEPKALWPRLALAAGLAVAEALESYSVEAGIKWPNDVWVGGRKICGVLIEAESDFAIIGIGLNVNPLAFPEDLAATATSLAIETGHTVNRAEVLAAVLQRFERSRHQIGADFSHLLRAIRQRCVLTGHRIRLQAADGAREGFCEGIGEAGELRLSVNGIVERILQADEIRLSESS